MRKAFNRGGRREGHAKITEKGKAMIFFAISAAFLRDLCGERLLTIQISHGEAFDGMRP